MSDKRVRRQPADVVIRPSHSEDAASVLSIILPVIRAGDAYALPTDMTDDDASAFWYAANHSVFIASDGDDVLGTYFLRANNKGGGDHLANAGFITADRARGRGIAKAMCLHAIGTARDRGFLAMQFNFVIATNHSVVRLWQSLDFDIVGRIPQAFRHPSEGLVDALIMHRYL